MRYHDAYEGGWFRADDARIGCGPNRSRAYYDAHEGGWIETDEPMSAATLKRVPEVQVPVIENPSSDNVARVADQYRGIACGRPNTD